jgi:hypothetical protein
MITSRTSAASTERLQAFHRRAEALALAAAPGALAEAGVDHDGSRRIAREPHVVVEPHRRVVRIAADEILGGGARERRVLDRVNLVGLHFILP